MRSALVLTVSDGVAAGTRDDESGTALAERLGTLGFRVERTVVADEVEAIGRVVSDASGRFDLVIATGGTGLGPRDRTPQALEALLDYEVPGFGEQMRAYGRTRTPMADLSRSLGGVLRSTLVVAVPGSVSGALDSLTAIEPILDHALETLGGHTRHAPNEAGTG
ncbi:MAG TPA: MogA/MoaB family molybdenum cofactor biosynthesis protein [Candidatus Limnocylindria bacterium]|nr:MogA/MoaB family molybdenum cofactor biosynthesis protein [Candidatus Limnocylindria bacterium]